MDIDKTIERIKSLSKESDKNFYDLLSPSKDNKIINKDTEIEIYKQIIISKDDLIDNLLKIFKENYKKEPEKRDNLFKKFR